MEYIMRMHSVKKKYIDFTALNGLNMNIPKHSIYGFVGKNGAGKTTLIRTICGLQNVTEGKYELFGVSHTDSRINDVRKKIGAIIESPSLYQRMNALDNMKQRCRSLGVSSANVKSILDFVGLGSTGKKTVKNFSLGMRQRLGIGMALCGDPEFLILDEPINGLDPQGILEIRNLITDLNRNHGMTILISSHILDELSKVATYYGFINNGVMINEFSSNELETYFHPYVHLSVTDNNVLKEYLDGNEMKYIINNDGSIDIFDTIDYSEFAIELYRSGCKILSINECGRNLEDFFISLVGGENNEKNAV
ncbi:MAG: ATP-binding cassette domain-containing protein [Ruminococcus sp.]|nr:ATP-binding cassette domain-containing protein [Ruminococcus sp.]